MTIAIAPLQPSVRRLTAEQFEAMPDAKGFELVDGLLVEKPVGTESSWLAGEIFGRIRAFAVSARAGWAFGPETAFRCFSDDANRVRKPDAAFVRYGRFPNERLPVGLCTFPPDLAVEVVSPNDGADELEIELQEYLTAGVRLIWVVFPEARSARVLRLKKHSSELTSADTLDGEDVLPGLRISLSELYASIPPAAPETPASSSPLAVPGATA